MKCQFHEDVRIPYWLIGQPPALQQVPIVFSAPVPSIISRPAAFVSLATRSASPLDAFQLSISRKRYGRWFQFAGIVTPQTIKDRSIQVFVCEKDGTSYDQGPSSNSHLVQVGTWDQDSNAVSIRYVAAPSGISCIRLHAPRLIVDDKEEVEGRLKFRSYVSQGNWFIRMRFLLDFPKCPALGGFLDIWHWTTVPIVGWELRLINRHAAHHRRGLWDLGDKGSVWIRSLFSRIELEDTADEVSFSVNEQSGYRTLDSAEVVFHQESSGEQYWRHANHVTYTGRVSPRFAGGFVADGKQVIYTKKLDPVWAYRCENTYLAMAIDSFGEAFPRAVKIHRNVAVVEGFPTYPDRSTQMPELQGGECFRVRGCLVWLEDRLLSREEWNWYRAPCHAFPKWDYLISVGALQDWGIYRSPRRSEWAKYVSARDIVQELEKKIIRQDEYGWRHMGDIPADHEQVYYSGKLPFVSHFNNQYDLLAGLLYLLLYSQDARLLPYIDRLARHVADIDVYHTQEDRAAYNHGLFWHTDHYQSAGLATHRSFSRLQSSVLSQQGGGPSCEHLYSTGLCLYYLLTGEAWAKETIFELAEFVLSCDSGKRSVFRYLDKGPTGLASRTRDDNYHGPGRGPGNAIETLLNAWLLSGDVRFTNKVKELIQRCCHPDDDVASYRLLDAENRWSYTVFLEALTRFIQVSASTDGIDCAAIYASRVLQKYAEWMASWERPYLDNSADLEYPTETWPCQDLRKSFVLKWASRLVGRDKRAKLLRKGQTISQKAWTSINRFSTRYMTRPLALLLNIGLREASVARLWDEDLQKHLGSIMSSYPVPTKVPFVRIQTRVLRKLPLICQWVIKAVRYLLS